WSFRTQRDRLLARKPDWFCPAKPRQPAQQYRLVTRVRYPCPCWQSVVCHQLRRAAGTFLSALEIHWLFAEFCSAQDHPCRSEPKSLLARRHFWHAGSV